MSPAVITLLVLLVMVVFFVTEKLPAALVAMLGGSVLVVCGIIEPAELFSAFSGSTIVLVAAMMVVGSALFHTGIAALTSFAATYLPVRAAARKKPVESIRAL